MTFAKIRWAFLCFAVLGVSASCSPSSPAASQAPAAGPSPAPTLAALPSLAAAPATGAPASPTPQTLPDPTGMAILDAMEQDGNALLAFMTSTPELRALFGGVFLDHPGQWPDVSGSQTVLQLRATAEEADAIRRQLPPLTSPERLRIDLVQCTEAHLQALYDQLLSSPAVVDLMTALALDTRHNAVDLVIRPSAAWVDVNGVIDKSSLPAEVVAVVDDPCVVVSQADVQVTRLPALDVTPTPAESDLSTPAASTPEAAATTAACVATTVVFDFDNPETVGVRERESVRWRLDGAEYALAEHTSGVYQIERDPAPGSRLVVFSVITNDTVPGKSATLLVDMTSGAYKMLGTAYVDFPKYLAAWLPEGRLAWIDDRGDVNFGSFSAHQSLDAPARMTDLWVVTPDRLLTRDETYQFWFFDLPDAVWSPLPAGESEKITTRWVESAAVSDDGSYVFFFYQGYSAILDTDSGTIQIVSPFASPAEYYTVVDGTEGDILTPPRQIAGTPYWFFAVHGIFREFSGVRYPSIGFVVDSRTGEVLQHEALGIPSDVAIYDTFLSPDETWLAVEVVEATQSLKNRPAKVAQTWFISLASGETRVEEGEFAGWKAEGQAESDLSLACREEEITIPVAPSP